MLPKKTKMLGAYSTAAVAFLLLNKHINSQVIYTDIDPDTILDEINIFPCVGFDLDLNGTTDFVFKNYSFTFLSATNLTYRLRQDLIALPNNSLNALVGVSQYYYAGYSNHSWNFASAFDKNELIDNELSWQTDNWQFLALRSYTYFGGIAHLQQCVNCQWYGYYAPNPTINKYLGVRFTDDIGQSHFG